MRLDGFQFCPQFPYEQDAEGAGEESKGAEQLKPCNDGHEKADGKKSQLISEKFWLQEFPGQPGDYIEKSQPQGKGVISLERDDEHPRKKDGSSAENRERIDDTCENCPEREPGDAKQIVSGGAFKGDHNHDPELGAKPSSGAGNDPSAGVGDRNGEGELIEHIVKMFPVSGKEQDREQI